MIRWLGKWLIRAIFALGVLILVLMAPVVWVEFGCKGPDPAEATAYEPLINDPAWQRAESNTLLTYPEWHIVHAYEDYAAVIAKGDPHQFGFLRSIGGFWGSLCDLTKVAGAHGGVPAETKTMVYTIGVSFTAELLAKAAYEETLGRVAVLVRGPDRAALDDLSARQAAEYAKFLQQVPWYRWDFTSDAAALSVAATDAQRDRERALALGIEYKVKSAYAGLIAAAVESTGKDELRIRTVVSGLSAEALARIPGVTIIAARPEGTEVETDRYRVYTGILTELAARGANVVEIAGNDEIMLTLISPEADRPDALASLPRQGADDYRHLMLLPVSGLSEYLRALANGPDRLEHVHDY